MSESAPGAPRRWLNRPLRVVVTLAVAAQVGLLVAAVVHGYATKGAAAGSDFAPMWLGSTVWRTVGHAQAYDASAQAAVFAHLAGVEVPLIYPYTWAPGSLLLGIPFSALPLDGAFDAWVALQVLGLGAAAFVAASAAAPRLEWGRRLAVSGAAVASAGAVATALYGQWDAIPALGVAIAYALWRRGHEGRAALVLTLLLLSGKPHLALGLLAFAAGRGSWRGWAGIAAGVALSAALDLALVQTGGLQAWWGTLGTISTLSTTASLSLFGLFANLFGGGAAVQALAAAGAVALLGCAAWFGWLSRRRATLQVCLLGATCVSLLVSPHLFAQDLALLVPVAAAMLATALVQRDGVGVVLTVTVVGVASVAAEYQVLPVGSLRIDPFVPLLLLGLVAWAWRAAATRVPATVADREAFGPA